MDRKTLSESVVLGPLTRRLVRQASETWDDFYPAWQGYAEECEALLQFVADRNQFNRFVSRLTASRQKRDEALNEIRVGYLMESLGYPILDWEPTDAVPKNVEFSIDLGSEFGVGYVEVKSPGWEGELSQEERNAGRKNLEKHIDMEGRTARPVQIIRRTVEKAAPKFTGKFPSLVVISDDCFVHLGDWGWAPLKQALTSSTIAWGLGLFQDQKYQSIGAVALLWAKSVSSKGVEYAAICLDNPNAAVSAKLPVELIRSLCTMLREPSRDTPQAGQNIPRPTNLTI